MVTLNTLIAASATLLTLSTAAPTAPNTLNWIAPHTSTIHRVYAGSNITNNGLHFEPEHIFANVGDYIEFHFLQKNHTVTQSSFDKPCEPLTTNTGTRTGFSSGFNFPTQPDTENANVFVVQVTSKFPVWFYCSQTVGNHCQAGMSGVINVDPNGPNSLAAYKEKAKGAVTVQASEDALEVRRGFLGENTFCEDFGRTGIKCSGEKKFLAQEKKGH